MRRVILADDVWSPEGHPEVKIAYGALTTPQNRQAEGIKSRWFADQVAKHEKIVFDLPSLCPEYIEFVCRHGIRSVKGLELEDENGKVSELKVEPVDGLYGKCVSEEDWAEIIPFFPPVALDIWAGSILGCSPKPSTAPATSTKTKSRRSKRS